MSAQELIDGSIIMTELKPEITWVNLTKSYVASEVVFNLRKGLSKHAQVCNSEMLKLI